MKTYTTSALARISGISRQQLMRWDRAGLLRPERRARGRASDRVYTWEQALAVIALGELQRRGVSNRRIRAASARMPPIAERSYLVFDGDGIHAKDTPAEVVDLLSRIDGGGRVLRVETLAERLA